MTYQELADTLGGLEREFKGNSTWPVELVPEVIRPWIQPDLNNPPGDIDWLSYLWRLKEVVPADTLWTGHGNYDVHEMFMELVEVFEFEHWLFCANLSANCIHAWLKKMCL